MDTSTERKSNTFSSSLRDGEQGNVSAGIPKDVAGDKAQQAETLDLMCLHPFDRSEQERQDRTSLGMLGTH